MLNSAMMEKVTKGAGFIAALDQSGGSTPGALAQYGISQDAFSNDGEMYALIHAMRVRIMTAPAFSGDRVLGAILFERTMDGLAEGQPVPAYLWSKGVVPFLKVDKGLEDQADGVKLMKPITGLGELLARASALGVFGTKMRSVIDLASPSGIAAIVEQQFAVAEEILAHGLMPIIEPEVSIKSPERAASDRLLLDALLSALEGVSGSHKVMLKLSIPSEANLFKPLVDHPRVARVVALSGGFSRQDACNALAQNSGIIASFSRALLEELRADMSDEAFNSVLDRCIAEIFAASNC